MLHPKFSEHSGKFKFALAAAVMLALVVVVSRATAATSYGTDTPLTLSGPGISLIIKAGSSVRSIKTNSDYFTVKLNPADSFSVLYPGAEPGRLANDAGLPECNLTSEGNMLAVSGRNIELTVTPVAEPCAAPDSSAVPAPVSTSSGGNTVTMVYPNGKEVFEAGGTRVVLWQSTGSQVKKINLLLSLDGGATFSIVVAENLPNSGSYAWVVPDSLASSSSRLLVEALSADGRVVATDASDLPFEILPMPSAQENGAQGAEPAPEEGAAEGAEDDPTAEPKKPSVGSAAGIIPDPETLSGSEGSLTEISGRQAAEEVVETEAEPPHPNCPAALIKAQDAKAVYYCASNGRRYVFPNQQVYFSWYQDFSGIQEIGGPEMAAIPLGGNVTYKPDSRLVKVVTNPKVYSVAAGRVLRWIKDEISAIKHFGSDWGKKVDDLPEALFSDYKEGEILE